MTTTEQAEAVKFDYMLLARLQMDCEYFTKTSPHINHLWAGNVEDQIAKMKELWTKLVEKPEWLSFEQILTYEEQMKEDTD